MADKSAFERLGGEAGLRPIVTAFVARLYADIMIGFFFSGVRQGRIEELEYQYAAAHLGAERPYRGRGMRQAHAKHAIAGGHFARRQQLLRETMASFDVPEDIAQTWLLHQEQQRTDIVVPQQHPACPGDAAADPAQKV